MSILFFKINKINQIENTLKKGIDSNWNMH